MEVETVRWNLTIIQYLQNQSGGKIGCPHLQIRTGAHRHNFWLCYFERQVVPLWLDHCKVKLLHGSSGMFHGKFEATQLDLCGDRQMYDCLKIINVCCYLGVSPPGG